MTIREEYQQRYDTLLIRLAVGVQGLIADYLDGVPRIDRVCARAKSVERFVTKSEKLLDGHRKYSDPLAQIQDQVGARIITFYLSDVADVAQTIEKYFRPVESKDLVPESEWEFGYFGRHYILLMPTDIIESDMDSLKIPEFFELQIKTLFQHAWSEAEHDLGYKPGVVPLNADEKRRLAFTAAQSWGADRIFNELQSERSNVTPQ
jgi:putative GTP pyrophosphokinase